MGWKKEHAPTERTIGRVKRIQRLIEAGWRSKDACKEIGMSPGQFYKYRARIGLLSDGKNVDSARPDGQN